VLIAIEQNRIRVSRQRVVAFLFVLRVPEFRQGFTNLRTGRIVKVNNATHRAVVQRIAAVLVLNQIPHSTPAIVKLLHLNLVRWFGVMRKLEVFSFELNPVTDRPFYFHFVSHRFPQNKAASRRRPRL
jgi:hypothetical protein